MATTGSPRGLQQVFGLGFGEQLAPAGEHAGDDGADAREVDRMRRTAGWRGLQQLGLVFAEGAQQREGAHRVFFNRMVFG